MESVFQASRKRNRISYVEKSDEGSDDETMSDHHCNTCSKDFNTTAALEKHSKEHNGEFSASFIFACIRGSNEGELFISGMHLSGSIFLISASSVLSYLSTYARQID